MSDNAATILHTQPDGNVQHLQLTGVLIDATVVDVSAHIVVSHAFKNDSNQTTGRAKYVFPVPASAAVCAFEMETSDGKFVVGEVKEKTEAEAQYRTAVEAGRTAGIVNWAGDDVFTISVGSIRARTSVITKIVFVMSLMDDSSADEIRLQLPVSIGSARYGPPLPEAQDTNSPEATTRVRFSASIQTSGRLLNIHSPSHKEVGIDVADQEGTSLFHHARASFSSSSFLLDDFVLAIRSEGLDAPRCFAEDEQHGTIALQLMVTPKFDIPRPPTQEYLFLVDRSGSMSGGPIEIAKLALQTLLHIIPAKGSYVNIFSFGSNCDDGLWPRSRLYGDTSLKEAALHVEGMGANMGGTEICAAVSKVLRSRMTSTPTIVYVLTDGSVTQYEIDTTVAAVDKSVQQTSLSGTFAPLRVFTLGIGNQVSTALCEGIARAGRGVSLFATNSSDLSELLAKCSRLVGAGIHPIVANISVDWAATPTEDQPTPDETGRVGLQPHPPILQSPPSLTTLYRNHRFVVYAILRTHVIPPAVTLRGEVQNGRTNQISHTVPVIPTKRFSSLAYSSAFLHALAARNVIRDVRDGRRIPEASTHGATPEDVRKEEIVRLGVRYQLASEFTSFVGVDEGATVEALQRAWRDRRAERRRERRGHIMNSAISAVVQSWGAAANMIVGVFSWFLGSGPVPTRTGSHNVDANVPGGFSIPSPSLSQSSRSSSTGSDASDAGQEGGENGYWADDTASTMSSLSSHDSVRVFRPTRRRWVRWPRRPAPRAPSPDIHATSSSTTLNPALRSRPAPRTEDLDLIQLQAWDGSFPATASLMDIMGRDLATEETVAAQLGVEVDIWATILTLEYLVHKLQDQQELLDGLLVKVLEFAEGRISRVRIDELRVHARGLGATS